MTFQNEVINHVVDLKVWTRKLNIINEALLYNFPNHALYVWMYSCMYGKYSPQCKFLPLMRVDWWGDMKEQDSVTCYTFTPCVRSFTCLSIEYWIQSTLWLYITCDWQSEWPERGSKPHHLVCKASMLTIAPWL